MEEAKLGGGGKVKEAAARKRTTLNLPPSSLCVIALYWTNAELTAQPLWQTLRGYLVLSLRSRLLRCATASGPSVSFLTCY
jgi:hypothetical protein